jgi:enamine deaminase RidA (YjgF/YER057c/UK114 family)
MPRPPFKTMNATIGFKYRKPQMPTPDQKLESLGYPLDRTLSPGAIYKPVVIDGTTAYVSGCVPFDGDKKLVSRGKVPSQVSLEEARKAAALCAANILRLIRQELGSLERVERVLRVTGYVNSDADFTEQHLVINGASQLFVDIFGDAGMHARSAVGMAQLPLGASVEVEAILKLRR